MWGGVALLCGLVLFQISNAIEVDLTVEINAGAIECFWQRIKSRVATELEYQVTICMLTKSALTVV